MESQALTPLTSHFTCLPGGLAKNIPHSSAHPLTHIQNTAPVTRYTQHFHAAQGPKDTNKDVKAENCFESEETNEERKPQPLIQY